MKKRAWLATFFDKIDVAGNCEGVRNEQTANCKVKKMLLSFGVSAKLHLLSRTKNGDFMVLHVTSYKQSCTTIDYVIVY